MPAYVCVCVCVCVYVCVQESAREGLGTQSSWREGVKGKGEREGSRREVV